MREALQRLSDFGGFYSGAGGTPGLPGFSSISLTSDTAYDAYLEFEGLESLMQQYYESLGQDSREYVVTFPDASETPESPIQWDLSDYVQYTQPSLLGHATKKNAAFILMPMDPENDELEDVYETIKEVCASFSVQAYRADEIQHQDRITDRILSEIRQCELLIADLSYERPNVYYEIGYAHALQKRPVLYRKHGTALHFDLLVHNVPEYKNVTQLKRLLVGRLEAILGRSPNPPK